MRKPIIVLGVVALALAAPVIPASATSARTGPAGHASVRPVLLPTGDEAILRTTAGGGTSSAVLPGGSGVAHTYIGLTLGGHHYEVPATAVPYLDNGLDMSMFDVTALAATSDAAKQVPVVADHGTGAQAVPGLTVTGTSANTESGYLNPAGAKRFGAALTQQYLADKAKRTFGHAGMFNGNRISSVTAHAAAPAQTGSALHTITVAGNGTDGRPDSEAFVLLANVDDLARVEAGSQLFQGTAKFTGPAGNYLAIAAYFDTDADGNVTAEHDVIDSQVKVTGDRTIRLDAKRATSQLTITTPRPSLNSGGGFYLSRADAKGDSLGLSLSFGAGVPVWISPQPAKVTVGTLNSYPQEWLTSPPAPGTPYAYDLQFLSTGTIPAQRYTVSAKNLATLNNTFNSEFPTAGLLDVQTAYPFEAAMGAIVDHVESQNMPGATTIYVPGDPTLLRNTEEIKYTALALPLLGFFGFDTDFMTAYGPGRNVTEDWNRFPLHPAADVDPHAPADASFANLVIPGAVRSGDTESFYLTPFSDNQPGHLGSGFYGEPRDTINGYWELDQDGTKVAGDTIAGGPPGNFQFDQQVPVSASPSTMELMLDANRTGPMYALSTSTHTRWTWRSAHQQGTTLPAPWTCSDSGLPANDCAVEPLMNVEYGIDNIDGFGVANGEAAQGVGLTFGHIDGAATSVITGATVQYSTDDGATWHDATVTGTGAGHYHASYVIDELHSGTFVSLKVTAQDAAGGSISESITRAYQLS